MAFVRSGSVCLLALLLAACGGSGGQLPLLPPDSSLTYNSPPAFTVTVPISPVVPTHNVYLRNFSIVPELPAGLVLDSTTGVISGTPTQVSEATRYTVSAPDGNVALTATLVITVNPLPQNIDQPRAAHAFPALPATSPSMIDLGNTADFERISFDGNIYRVLALGPLSRTCSPTRPCHVEGALAGATAAIRQQTGWNTYSVVDGALIAHLDIAPGFASAWTLATDGSYLLFAGGEGVQAITPEGMTLFTSAADPLTAAAAVDHVWFDSESTLPAEAR